MARHNRTAWSVALASVAVMTIATTPASGQNPAARYEACLDLAAQAPADAIAEAEAWEIEDGGNLARYCAAHGYLAAGSFDEAGERFADLASELAAVDPPSGAPLYLEAAEAWLLADAPWRADEAAGQGLAIAPDSVALRRVRAFARAAIGDHAGARDELTLALDTAPGEPELLLLRAAAHRYIGDFDRALSDAEQALSARPDDPDILLERGNIHRLRGNTEAARSDWQRVLDVASGTVPAAAAEINLRRLGGR